MTLSFRPELNSAEQVVSSLSTENRPTVTDEEMMQAVRTLLLGLGETQIEKDLKILQKEL